MIKRFFVILIGVKLLAAILIFGFDMAGISHALAQSPKEQPEAKEEGVTQETIDMELVRDIRKKEEEIARKEEELKRREERVLALEANLDKKIEELKRLQVKLDELIKIRDDVEDKNVSTLAKTYGAMPPPEAAARLKGMNRRIALKILEKMKSKQSAKILSSLDPKTASQITEQLAKRPLK